MHDVAHRAETISANASIIKSPAKSLRIFLSLFFIVQLAFNSVLCAVLNSLPLIAHMCSAEQLALNRALVCAVLNSLPDCG